MTQRKQTDMRLKCNVVQGLEELPGKGKKHVGLSLCVQRLHSGLTSASLEEGMGLAACVSSVEDHGYILNLGIKVALSSSDSS